VPHKPDRALDMQVPTTTSATPLLTGQQAAEYLAVSVDTLSYWRTVGRGPAFVKFTRARQGVVRYRREDLDRFIDECVQTSTSARRLPDSTSAPRDTDRARSKGRRS
jgi:hypothetical protein